MSIIYKEIVVEHFNMINITSCKKLVNLPSEMDYSYEHFMLFDRETVPYKRCYTNHFI